MPKNKKEGIMQMIELASGRGAMFDALKRLYTHEFLSGLNQDQIMDLYEEQILLPQLDHVKLTKPIKPRPNSNIYDLPINDNWWELKPKPKPTESEKT
tara:strand:- start:123 stop:416 length:294 start_codon:yes stop_codon:yes gene_type:complete